jgi:hypothetical protein
VESRGYRRRQFFNIFRDPDVGSAIFDLSYSYFLKISNPFYMICVAYGREGSFSKIYCRILEDGVDHEKLFLQERSSLWLIHHS